MEISIDRSLPITVTDQIKGQIVYAIAYGELRPGEPLPSVREFAAKLGVAPMTITRVYRELCEDRLIVTRAGVGTFVADIEGIGLRSGCQDVQRDLQQVVDTYVRQALSIGCTVDQVRTAFLQRLERHRLNRKASRLALVGNFRSATESYAREIERILSDLNVSVLSLLVSELKADLEGVLARLNGVEVVITMPTRLQEVCHLLESHGYNVVTVAFQIDQSTRHRLSSIPPNSRMGLVSTYPVFLSSMIEGIVSYALLRTPPLCALLEQKDRVKDMLTQVDVVVYATGSQRVLDWLSSGVEAFEYLHTPEPNSVNRLRSLIC